MADLTFTSDGTLYGWAEADEDDLYTVNLATGQATVVGDSGLSTAGSGLAANASNVIYFAGSGLNTISRVTGAPTFVASITGTSVNINAMAFDNLGQLFVAENDGTFGRIDPSTGVVTQIGPSVTRLDAIAFDPAADVPAMPKAMVWMTALLLAAMSLWLVARRRQGFSL